MGSMVVTGAQWGDEGKGRVVDWYAAQADIVARYQGGANAGHTVFVGDEQFTFHLLPTGILRGKLCVIGNGVVVDPEALLEEMAVFESKGVQVQGRLLISENAHLVMPYHKRLDAAHEKRLGEKRIGTTLRGIAPAYSDKYARTGLRVGDLVREKSFAEKLAAILEFKNELLKCLYGEEAMDFDQIFAQYREYRERLLPMIADTALLLNRALDEGKQVLFEGAQGALLDVDFGTYPFCTSSNPIAGGACVGTGIGPRRIDRVIGVVKAYTSRVGQGPFLTELPEEIAATWRERGGEFGSTTGRARRLGWFDAVIVRKAAMLSGLDAVAVTHLDVLDELDAIPVCTHYRHAGETLDIFPNSLEVLAECEPVYEELPGWKQPIRDARSPADLPANARRYLDRLAELIGAPICLALVGRRRDQTIVMS